MTPDDPSGSTGESEAAAVPSADGDLRRDPRETEITR